MISSVAFSADISSLISANSAEYRPTVPWTSCISFLCGSSTGLAGGGAGFGSGTAAGGGGGGALLTAVAGLGGPQPGNRHTATQRTTPRHRTAIMRNSRSTGVRLRDQSKTAILELVSGLNQPCDRLAM